MRPVPMLLILLAAAAPARACTCIEPPPPRDALALSAAVFAGEVRQVKPLEDSDLLEVTLDVYSLWKGPATDSVVVYTENNSAACGMYFGEGVAYLVYAFTEGGDKLHTDQCTRSTRLDQAALDLKALGPPAVVPARSLAWGPWKAAWR